MLIRIRKYNMSESTLNMEVKMEVVKFGLRTITEPAAKNFSSVVNQERTNSEGTQSSVLSIALFLDFKSFYFEVFRVDKFVQTKSPGRFFTTFYYQTGRKV